MTPKNASGRLPFAKERRFLPQGRGDQRRRLAACQREGHKLRRHHPVPAGRNDCRLGKRRLADPAWVPPGDRASRPPGGTLPRLSSWTPSAGIAPMCPESRVLYVQSALLGLPAIMRPGQMPAAIVSGRDSAPLPASYRIQNSAFGTYRGDSRASNGNSGLQRRAQPAVNAHRQLGPRPVATTLIGARPETSTPCCRQAPEHPGAPAGDLHAAAESPIDALDAIQRKHGPEPRRHSSTRSSTQHSPIPSKPTRRPHQPM